MGGATVLNIECSATAELSSDLSLGRRNILFLDDFTRSPANGLFHHAPNRRWLRGLLEGALVDAGYKSREWDPEMHADQVADFMRRLGLEPSVTAWAASTMVDPVPPGAEAWLDDLIRDDFVVGFELPVFLIRFLCRYNIPFLDISIDPVRFAQDLFLAARTNVPALAARLGATEVCADLVWADAGQLRAFFARRRPPGRIGSRIAVFFGQTNIDRSMVQNGKFLQPASFAGQIAAAAEGCDTLLIRRYPSEKISDQIKLLAKALPNARFSDENSYPLLCRDETARVISISSGILAEAKYFHKVCVALAEPDVKNAAMLPASCSCWYRMTISVAMPGFWTGQVLTAMPAAGLLRKSLGQKWGRTMFEPPHSARLLLLPTIRGSIRTALSRLFPRRERP